MIWMLGKIKIKVLFLHQEIPFSDTHILEDSQKNAIIQRLPQTKLQKIASKSQSNCSAL